MNKVPTGNNGLDTILGGGLPASRLYLLEGAPGSGKTTLALEFLLEGARRGERGLYVTLSETREELAVVAESHGWNIEEFNVFELSAVEEVLAADRDQTIFHPWEAELSETVRLVQAEIQKTQPTRIVFDSLSEMRLLAQDPLRYRRQILSLKQFFAGRQSTVLLIDDLTSTDGHRDTHLHSLCHGVITLERFTMEFGAARRRLQVQKLRGVDFVGGYHDFKIRKGGLDIFPRLIAAAHHAPFVGEPTSSGVEELDALLNGGPLRGTSTLISGPPGAGKTTVALQYIKAACERGERAVIYEFDERIGTLTARAKAFGLDLDEHVTNGRLQVQQIDPAELSPGEFACQVRDEVAHGKARMIIIDSLAGYLTAMQQEQQLILQMHELLSFLNQQGVVTFLISPQQGLLGSMGSDVNVSYIADAVLLLRFFEAGGRLRKAISVLKNRAGRHEDAIREFRIDGDGVRVGEPLTAFKGVLTGTPEYVGDKAPLLEERRDVP